MTEPAIVIRPMQPGDLAQVVALIHAAYAEVFDKLDPASGVHSESIASLAAKLDSGTGALALSGSLAVGSVLHAVQGQALYLSRLAVLPAYRQRGIGWQLVTFVEAVAQNQGLAAVTLCVRITLPQNLAFYQRLGYAISRVGCHPGYTEPTFYTMQKQVRPAV